MEKYQDSLAKISELQEENTRLKSNLEEQESRQKELYLKMFLKGQEAVKFQRDEQVKYINSPYLTVVFSLSVFTE